LRRKFSSEFLAGRKRKFFGGVYITIFPGFRKNGVFFHASSFSSRVSARENFLKKSGYIPTVGIQEPAPRAKIVANEGDVNLPTTKKTKIKT
jgi:hypothetical protein